MAINDLMYRFTGNPKPAESMETGKDKELELLIDEAGRKEVFRRARRLGWHRGQIPPKWVWTSICADILHDRKSIREEYKLKEKSCTTPTPKTS